MLQALIELAHVACSSCHSGLGPLSEPVSHPPYPREIRGWGPIQWKKKPRFRGAPQPAKGQDRAPALEMEAQAIVFHLQ